MKKFIVSVIIIGAFVLYSFVYNHSNTAAIVPGSSTPSSSSSRSSLTTPSPTLPPSTSGQTAPTPTSVPGALYKNGSYTGSVADAHWGYIQVKAIVQNGKITDVQFLQYPNDRNRSVDINQYADPQLTSEAFIQSLTDALAQAKV